MKINQPVTEVENEMKPGTTIVSTTNLKGIITSANQEFVDISGFSEKELIGKNHNMVRHPDVPAAAFQDLWETIQAGKPWVGIVKNRCKNGDHYWVKANVTPVFRNGQISEYVSVRTKPSRDEISQAQILYSQINTGNLPATPFLEKINFFKKLKVSQKLMLAGLLSLLIVSFLVLRLFILGSSEIAFSEKKILGIKYIVSVRQIMQNMPQHRGMTNAYLNGKKSLKKRILDKRKQVDENFSSLANLDKDIGEDLKTTAELERIVSEWNELKLQAFSLPAKESFSRHTKLLEKIISFIAFVGDSSNLVLDSSIDTYYLSDILVNRIPELTEKLGRVRGLGAGVISRGGFNSGQKQKLLKLQVGTNVLGDGIKRAVTNVLSANKSLEAQLMDKANKARASIGGYDSDIDKLLSERFSELNAIVFFDKGTAVINNSFALFDASSEVMEEILTTRINDMRTQFIYMMLVVFAIVFVVVFVSIMIVRNILSALRNTASEFSYMAEGDYVRDIDIHRHDEIGDLLRSLKSMQIKLGFDINDARNRADSMYRIKSALDNVSANVMVANIDNEIIYVNESLMSMFRNAEPDLKEDLPEFNAETILGSNMDIYHKEPEKQRGLIASLSESLNAKFIVGGRSLEFTANPVLNDQGIRLGTVVEWKDRTDEVAVEKEVDAIVTAAQQGDLQQRIDLDGKTGFFYQLSGRINLLIGVIEESFNDMARVMGAMSQGDLTQEITEEYGGKFGEVKDSINSTITNLEGIIKKILSTSEFIRNSSEEIVAGNNNLSQRAETQASTLEETASSMEELTSTVKNNADNAQQASQQSDHARIIAEQGGEVVKEAVIAMDEITSSSSKISEIIGVIDEIAFQTNLLALNASVEAARAGEQGRGFAVVATEVRNLAQRSASAAKEIKELINDSVDKISTGAELVNKSGTTLEEIVSSVKGVGVVVSEIAASSQEQSVGIEEVNKAVTQMDEMTQQNAALAEQAAASSEASLQSVTDMTNLVSFFNLKN